MVEWLRDFINFLNGFRKLTICVVVLVLAAVFLISGHINGDQFASVLTITVPSYFAGNIGEHLTETAKQWLQSKVESND